MSRPDLSALPREVRVRIAAAETQGWDWERFAGGWALRSATLSTGVLVFDAFGENGAPLGTRKPEVVRLPDYLTDPAAWGALLEKERVGIFSPEWARHGQWEAAFRPPEWHRGDTPGEAVCAAILAKHNVDWTTLEPVA